VVAIGDFSNQLISARSSINDLNQLTLTLTNDLAASQQQLALSQQEAAQLSNSLAAASATLESTKSTLISARDQINNLNTHIGDLETQNKVLDQRATDLTNTIAQLNAAIENSQSRLAMAETNRLFIEQQLQKQIAQRAELEHKFNDIDEVRTQVKKLRDEMFVARRLQWMKNDNSGKKGAELLMQKNTTTATTGTATNAKPDYNLNVEVGSDGSVKVIPPLVPGTNTPAR
jgi:chromosome segregation ATPase